MDYIQNDRLYDLLRNRLFIETVIRANSQSTAKNLFTPVFDTSRTMIGLKLPLALPKDTIKKDDASLSPQDLSEWKTFLEKVNKK